MLSWKIIPALFLLLLPNLAIAANAKLILFPTRIIMDANERYASVQVKNTGDATGEYTIEAVDMRMDETGIVRPLKEGETEPFSAKDILRFSPRSMTLAPDQAQSVRLILKKGSNLQVGEYRTHLRVRTINNNVEKDKQENTANNQSENTRISVGMNTTMSIPIIVRKGETHYESRLLNPQLTKSAEGKSQLMVDIQHSGNRSSMGDLTVTYYPNNSKEKYILQVLAGIPVYRGVLTRPVKIPLNAPDGISLNTGKLHIAYSAQTEEDHRLLAETTYQIR